MKYALTLEFESKDELEAFVTSIEGGPASTGKAKGKGKAAPPVDDADDLLGGGEEAGEGEDEVTEDMIAEKVKELVSKGKKDKVVALLAKFKAKGVSALSEDKYPTFMEGLLKIK